MLKHLQQRPKCEHNTFVTRTRTRLLAQGLQLCKLSARVPRLGYLLLHCSQLHARRPQLNPLRRDTQPISLPRSFSSKYMSPGRRMQGAVVAGGKCKI